MEEMLQKKNIYICAEAVSKEFSSGKYLQPQIKITDLHCKTPQAPASPSTPPMLKVANDAFLIPPLSDNPLKIFFNKRPKRRYMRHT